MHGRARRREGAVSLTLVVPPSASAEVPPGTAP